MIFVKIILIAVGFIFASCWLTILIGAGVESGLKNYFNKSSKKEED